jgi:hypothetical protein
MLDIKQRWGIFVVIGFSHGQLYVVISRVTSSANITIFSGQGPNAPMCVYLTIHITKLQLQTTFPKPLYIPHS